jgi:hypothetical protein
MEPVLDPHYPEYLQKMVPACNSELDLSRTISKEHVEADGLNFTIIMLSLSPLTENPSGGNMELARWGVR